MKFSGSVLALALVLVGCGQNTYHAFGPNGEYLGTTQIVKQTLSGGSEIYTKDTWDHYKGYVGGELAVGKGLGASAVEAGALVGAAYGFGYSFPKNVADNFELSNDQAQGQNSNAQSSSSATVKPVVETPAPVPAPVVVKPKPVVKAPVKQKNVFRR